MRIPFFGIGIAENSKGYIMMNREIPPKKWIIKAKKKNDKGFFHILSIPPLPLFPQPSLPKKHRDKQESFVPVATTTDIISSLLVHSAVPKSFVPLSLQASIHSLRLQRCPKKSVEIEINKRKSQKTVVDSKRREVNSIRGMRGRLLWVFLLFVFSFLHLLRS